MRRTRLIIIGVGLAAVAVGCDPGEEAVDGEPATESQSLAAVACKGDEDCTKAQFCQFKVGACGGEGVCAPRPRFCPLIFAPVCGCDGKTYGNACQAAGAGTSVAHQGRCEPKAPFCGGIAGIPCPGAGTCIDDPSDDCDPKNGGADCGGLCVCKARLTCRPGTHFDSSPGVCACVPDLPNPCATVLCAAGTICRVQNGNPVCVPAPGGGACGGNQCGPGQFCCNASCGTCAPIGGACLQIVCESPL
jgi:hypothetical protein